MTSHLDPQVVADYLGVATPDPRMELCAAAAEQWVRDRRCHTEPAVLALDPNVVLGTVMYAALLYTQRAQPQGFAGNDDFGSYAEDVAMAMSQVYRLVGQDLVVA